MANEMRNENLLLIIPHEDADAITLAVDMQINSSILQHVSIFPIWDQCGGFPID